MFVPEKTEVKRNEVPLFSVMTNDVFLSMIVWLNLGVFYTFDFCIRIYVDFYYIRV